MRPPHLPEFEKPPVSEVALGIQFAPIERFQAIHAASIWGAFRQDFPKHAEQPPLDPMFEIIGSQQREPIQLRFNLQTRPALPRLWFLREDETQLLQFQTDRLIHNWRKVAVDNIYPRYETIRGQFVEEVGRLAAVMGDNDLGSIEPNQCEVSYVNQIPIAAGTSPAHAIGEVLRFVSAEGLGAPSGELESFGAQASYVLRSPVGDRAPIGRLTVTCQPSQLSDGTPILSLTLTARGAPLENNITGAFSFFDLGREAIVTTFSDITTDSMHAAWGRTR